jgi:ribonuclease D
MGEGIAAKAVRYQLLDEPQAMRDWIDGLRSEPILAIDVEADSLFSYREKVCLVQISTASSNVILDPLSGDGLESLGAVLADAGIIKVFHGADYDVRTLKRDYGFTIRNLVDTMIAAQFTGRTAFGLAALLEEQFGIHADKKYQRADWSARPLDKERLSYAAQDTAYLLDVWQKLRAELVQMGRLEWAQEEFRLLEAVTPAPEQSPSCFDVKGAMHLRLKPRQLALLQNLVDLRDEMARAWDRPVFKALSSEVLLRWTEAPPRTVHDVLETPAANKGVLRRLAPRVLEAVRTAKELPLENCPHRDSRPYTPLTSEQRMRLERLKTAREQVAQRLGLAVGLLVNSETLEVLCRVEAQQFSGVLATVLKHWQWQVLGESLASAWNAPAKPAT